MPWTPTPATAIGQARSGFNPPAAPKTSARSSLIRSNYALRNQSYITLSGTDYSNFLVKDSVLLEQLLNTQADIARFTLIGVGPTMNAEVRLAWGAPDAYYFGGYVRQWTQKRIHRGASGVPTAGTAQFYYEVEAIGWEKDFAEAIVEGTSYTSTAAGAIVKDAIRLGLGTSKYDTTLVQTGPTIPYLYVDHMSVSDVIRRVASLSGYNWNIQPNKQVRFFHGTSYRSGFTVADTTYTFDNFVLTNDASQLRNKVWVRGAQSLSASTTYAAPADGTSRWWVLPYKPVNLAIQVGTVSKTVGIDGVHAESSYNYFFNYQAQTVRSGAGESTVPSGTNFRFTFQYYKPAVVIVQDTVSIKTYGTREHYVEDQSSLSLDLAVMIGKAELIQYSNPVVRGGFTTWAYNLYIGDYVSVNLSDRAYSQSVLIQRMTRRLRARRWDIQAEFTTVKMEWMDILQKFNFLADRTRENEYERINEVVGTTVSYTP